MTTSPTNAELEAEMNRISSASISDATRQSYKSGIEELKEKLAIQEPQLIQTRRRRPWT